MTKWEKFVKWIQKKERESANYKILKENHEGYRFIGIFFGDIMSQINVMLLSIWVVLNILLWNKVFKQPSYPQLAITKPELQNVINNMFDWIVLTYCCSGIDNWCEFRINRILDWQWYLNNEMLKRQIWDQQ